LNVDRNPIGSDSGAEGARSLRHLAHARAKVFSRDSTDDELQQLLLFVRRQLLHHFFELQCEVQNVEPCGKPVLLALDVSGSIGGGPVAGSCLTPREPNAAMALVTAATEEDYQIMGFSNRFIPLNISSRMRLDDIVNRISGLPFEATACALPMIWAREIANTKRGSKQG